METKESKESMESARYRRPEDGLERPAESEGPVARSDEDEERATERTAPEVPGGPDPRQVRRPGSVL